MQVAWSDPTLPGEGGRIVTAGSSTRHFPVNKRVSRLFTVTKRHLPGDKQERKPRPAFTETLKRQFREMVKAITNKTPAPEPTQPRRRREDTGRAAFRMAAGKIMRRAVRIPAAAYAAATYLWDTLDWLNPWQNDTASTSELGEDFHY